MTEPFGVLLRRHRLDASLTQEALAERAAISATAVAALERGRRRAPRLSTVRQLARALELDPAAVAELARAADADGDATDTPAPDVERQLEPEAVARPESARRWRTRFVGRGDELDTLRHAWDEHVRLVVVSGEAGIGKTRLTGELADALAGEGVQIAWGRGSEEGLGAYAPFVEIARELVVGADPARLARAIGDRGELTRLVPELAARVGPLPPATVAEAGTEQRLLFEAVGALIAGSAPALVVIDDLHWADAASIALLHYLVRDRNLGAVMIVATTRATDLVPAAAGLLADLGRHAPTVRIDLLPFDDAHLAELVGDVVGSAVANDVVRYVAEATDGNPFFAEEMTVQLIDSGALVDDEHLAVLSTVGDAAVPERVREMLHRRVVSLTRDTQDLLATGSVIGRRFELRVAGPASGLDGLRLADAVDDALLSGLVDETGPGRLAFSHALVQRAVADRLSSARAALIHRQVAEAVESAALDPESLPVQDLARHWAAVAAIDPSVATTAATWAVRAGDAALAAAAADEAIMRYEQASELWSTASRGHADALVRLGDALQYRGRADEADARYRQALQIARVLDDAALEARAAIGLGRRYPYWESDSDRIAALEHALGVLKVAAPEQDALRLTLMGLLVTQMINGFGDEEAARRDELVDALAAVADDPETSDATLSHLGQTRVYDGYEDPARLERVATRIASVGEGDNDLRVVAIARFARGLAALDRGEMDDLRSAAQRYDAVAQRLDDPRERSQAATVRATIAFIEGRYADSEALSADALTFGHASGDYNADLVFYAQGLLRAVDQGLAAAVLPLLLETDDYQQIPSFTAGTALCAAVAGETDLARELVERQLRTGFGGSPRGADRLAPTAFLAHTASRLGLVEPAQELLAGLIGQPCTAVRVGPLIGWWGPVDHHVGALLRVLGRLDEAEGHLRQALELETRMAARPFLARTRGELATVLELRGDDGAHELRAAARTEAEALGAAGIAAEIGATEG